MRQIKTIGGGVMVTGKIIAGGAGDEALKDAFAVREAVFVAEQGYAQELDRDEIDAHAAHALVFEGDLPIATARLYLDEQAHFHIGRVAVRRQGRGKGLGDLVMRMMLQSALGFGAQSVFLGAQEQAVGFYEKLGFVAYGPMYLDEGQPHRTMRIDAEAMQALFAGCAGCAGCGGAVKGGA